MNPNALKKGDLVLRGDPPKDEPDEVRVAELGRVLDLGADDRALVRWFSMRWLRQGDVWEERRKLRRVIVSHVPPAPWVD